MTYPVQLPALDGRDVLGLLAALGTLRLIRDETGIDARLAFDETSAVAVLHSPLRSIDEVVDALVGVVNTIPRGGVIPGVPAIFPTAKTGYEADPMRVPRDRWRETAERITGNYANPMLNRWLAALVTDLAVDANGRAAITPYSAPSGQQSLRTFFTKPFDHVLANPAGLLREALAGWRRVDNYTGEYLDHRALRSAANHPEGKSVEAGVPGATWLAIMALPLLRLTGTGTAVQATGWHTVTVGGRRQSVMVWPIWRQPLDTHGVTALFEHPGLRPWGSVDGITVDRSCWPPLGVFMVAGATRRPIEGRQTAGVLTPITVGITGHE